MTAARSVSMLLLALTLLAGCGSSTPKRPAAAHKPRRVVARADPICTPQARATLAGYLRVAAGSIAVKRSIGSNASPQCTFTVPRRHGRPLVMVANIYSGPQPYFILDRQEEEMSQVFGPAPTQAPPSTVFHLGLNAFWFPSLKQLGATDGIHLVTTEVLRPAMSLRRQRALDIALARPYLTAHVNPNGPLAHGYAAGGVTGASSASSSTTTGG